MVSICCSARLMANVRCLEKVLYCTSLPCRLARAARPTEITSSAIRISSSVKPLLAFPGCAVVISHDRWFLDRIATHILAFEGDSEVVWYEGNFADYEEDKKRRLGDDAVNPHRIKYRRIDA